MKRKTRTIAAGAVVAAGIALAGCGTASSTTTPPPASTAPAAPAPAAPASTAPAAPAPAAPASTAPASPDAVAVAACNDAWAQWQAIGGGTGTTPAQARQFANWSAAEGARVSGSGEPRRDGAGSDAANVAKWLPLAGQQLLLYPDTISNAFSAADSLDFACHNLGAYSTDFTGV
jgi:hypothetical protein